MLLNQCPYGVRLLTANVVVNGGDGVLIALGTRMGLVFGSIFVPAGTVSLNISLSRWGMVLISSFGMTPGVEISPYGTSSQFYFAYPVVKRL